MGKKKGVESKAVVDRERIYNEVKKEKRKKRLDMQAKIFRRIAIELGDVLLPFYIVISSAWIAVSTCLYVFGRSSNLFINYFNSGTAPLIISGFVLLGLLMFIVWIMFGMSGMWSYGLFLKLKHSGVRKKKTVIGRMFKI